MPSSISNVINNVFRGRVVFEKIYTKHFTVFITLQSYESIPKELAL